MPLGAPANIYFSDFLGDHDRRLIPVYEWLLEALDQADSTGPDPDIELVLSSVRELIARDSSPLAPFVHRRGWRSGVGRYHRSLVRLEPLLQQHIREACEVGRGDVEYLRPLRDLIPPEGSLDIFTLNYDCAVELVCQEMGIPYSDGFSTYWDPAQFDLIDRGIRLHKLHGSLLWFRTARTPQRLVKIPVVGSEEGAIRFFSDDEVSTSVIYPTLTKEQQVDPYATLMARLRSTLQNIDVLITIGYSFRDAYLKEVLLEKLHENERLRVIVVDPAGPSVLTQSDEQLGEAGLFSSARNRIQIVRRDTAEVLSRGLLLQLVRGSANARAEARTAERLRATGEKSSPVAQTAIWRFAEAEDIGEIVALLQQDQDGEWHRAVLSTARAHITDARSLALSLCGLIHGTDEDRTSIAQILTERIVELGAGAIYEEVNGSGTVGGRSRRIDVSGQDDRGEFALRKLALQHVLRLLDRLKPAMQWHVSSEIFEYFSALQEDLMAFERYFAEAAEGPSILTNRLGSFPENRRVRQAISERLDDGGTPLWLQQLTLGSA